MDEIACLERKRCETQLYYYRPQRSWAKVIFSQASVCPQGGVCLSACWDIPPGSRQPPREQTTPPGPDTPRDQTPPGTRPPWEHIPREHTPPGSRKWADYIECVYFCWQRKAPSCFYPEICWFMRYSIRSKIYRGR